MSNKKMSDVFDTMPLTVRGCFVIDGDFDPIECVQRSDAEAIALAVNSHDKLVEVLDEIMFDDIVMQELLGCELYDKAQALLKAIKGEQ